MRTLAYVIPFLILAFMIHLGSSIYPEVPEIPAIDFPIESPEVCEDVPLRNPGGLSWRMAQVCVGSYGLYVSSEANNLLPDQRDSMIYPVADSLILIATEKGYLKVDIQIRDRYKGRE